jgi:hypothetical protein
VLLLLLLLLLPPPPLVMVMVLPVLLLLLLLPTVSLNCQGRRGDPVLAPWMRKRGDTAPNCIHRTYPSPPASPLNPPMS